MANSLRGNEARTQSDAELALLAESPESPRDTFSLEVTVEFPKRGQILIYTTSTIEPKDRWTDER